MEPQIGRVMLEIENALVRVLLQFYIVLNLFYYLLSNVQ